MLSYVAFDYVSIRSSNMIGDALLARRRTYRAEGGDRRGSPGAMRYSCERQQLDGAWYYGEAKNTGGSTAFMRGIILIA